MLCFLVSFVSSSYGLIEAFNRSIPSGKKEVIQPSNKKCSEIANKCEEINSE